MTGSLCGVWVDETGRVHTTVATAQGGRETREESFRPFAWVNDTPPDTNLTVSPSSGWRGRARLTG